MFAFKTLLAAAPLLSLAAARAVPETKFSQPYVQGVSKNASSGSKSSVSADDVANCDHCYTCFTYFTPSGSRFLAFVGNMIVPNNDPSNSQATNFVWPGLQNNQNDADGLFVLQPVLNGFPSDNGAWSTFENYLVGGPYGDTQGNSVSTSIGETLSFSMKIASDGKSWDISSNGATNNYPITDDLIEALFCGEFYNSNWNFGDLVFTDVQIVSQGNDSSWCKAETADGVSGNFEGVSVEYDGNGNTVCNISKLTMNIA